MAADAPMPDTARSLTLLPGALSFVPAGWRLQTLLGSCVSVVVWQPRLRLGGMCHFLLPERVGHRRAGPDGRFAPDALAMLEQQMHASGLDTWHFVAHVAGGAHCLARRTGQDDATLDIGRRNTEAALQWCRHMGMPVLQVAVGGRTSRQVDFDTSSGEVRIRAGLPIPETGLAPTLPAAAFAMGQLAGPAAPAAPAAPPPALAAKDLR